MVLFVEELFGIWDCVLLELFYVIGVCVLEVIGFDVDDFLYGDVL